MGEPEGKTQHMGKPPPDVMKMPNEQGYLDHGVYYGLNDYYGDTECPPLDDHCQDHQDVHNETDDVGHTKQDDESAKKPASSRGSKRPRKPPETPETPRFTRGSATKTSTKRRKDFEDNPNKMSV